MSEGLDQRLHGAWVTDLPQSASCGKGVHKATVWVYRKRMFLLESGDQRLQCPFVANRGESPGRRGTNAKLRVVQALNQWSNCRRVAQPSQGSGGRRTDHWFFVGQRVYERAYGTGICQVP
jgi:hypothetical protein